VATYVPESFDEQETRLLQAVVTNVDRGVFVVRNLDESVKGALFARYSRSALSLRRLYLKEFTSLADHQALIPGDGQPGTDRFFPRKADEEVGLQRAQALFERVLGEYGDDSVAQLAGVHVACEQVSNVLTKVLERPRLMSYLEQSTRYVRFDWRLPNGCYPYYRDPELLASPLGARYVGDMDAMFASYAEILSRLEADLAKRLRSASGVDDLGHRRALRARALDAVRGLLPAGTLANVGLFGDPQAYEALLLHLREHPLPEARQVGEELRRELMKVIPAFLTRIDRTDRGGVWASYLSRCRRETQEVVDQLSELAGPYSSVGNPEGSEGVFLDEATGASVKLLDYDPEGEEKVLAAMVFESSSLPEAEIARRLAKMSQSDRERIWKAYVGERSNRRHKPGRAFERTSYRFEVEVDYGAFRDLQRHRMATLQWQQLSPRLGFGVPSDVEEAGLASSYREAMERSGELWEALQGAFPAQSAYAVAFGYRVRFVMHMNAREAMHVIELRSAPQGHASYRKVAQLMHRAIKEQARHCRIADSMVFLDTADHELGRLQAERAAIAKRQGGPERGAELRAPWRASSS